MAHFRVILGHHKKDDDINIIKKNYSFEPDLVEEEILSNNSQLKINALNAQLQALMNWIISDNQKHRMWLENEIHKLNPDIEIPVCPNPPQIFITDHPTSTPNTNESPPQN